ncbi:MAG: efflux RND transporter periplasmic adaptor subunit [Ignavibacteriae bacterium]|nr:efflux RND transporter periplasmic adaptor subunit [Ignavibacteriota bacterium]
MYKKFNYIIFITLITVSFIGCKENIEVKAEEHSDDHSDEITLTMETIKQIKLATFTASLIPISGTITIPAEVKTNQDNEAQIGSLIQGRVNKVFVKVGDYVKVGQVLMTVEGLEVGEIKSGFLKARANYEYAKTNYERQKKLFEAQIGSQKSFLESQSEYVKAEAEYHAEDKKIHSVGLSDDDILKENDGDKHTSGTLPIKSLINGIVIERNVVIGQQVDVSTTAFKIINTSTVWIDGHVYEKDLNKINNNTKTSFLTGSSSSHKFYGNIIYVGQTVDDKTRTILIRGEFNNAGNELKPQMFGELQIETNSNVKALLITETSIVKDGENYNVFVRTSDTKFEKRDVKIGSSINGMVEIKEGITEGEKIVTDGVFYLKSELKKDELEEHEH